MSTDSVPDPYGFVHALPSAGPRRRTLSFIGLIEDDSDAAARSEEILREEIRRRA